jgi:hypothetical protein
MTDDDWRIKEFFLFYYLKKQSVATSTIRQSSFVIRSLFRKLCKVKVSFSIRLAAFQASGGADT